MVAAKDNDLVLAAEGVTKSFGGIKALDGAHLDVYAGQVNAVVGENGAGNSTLMKVLAGVYQDYDGRIFLHGRQVSFAHPRQAQEAGVAIIHQELNLIPHLSVAENIFLGREFVDSLGLIDFKRMYSKARTLLDRLDLHVDPRRSVRELRVGQQQVVEIARALALDARVIIMDEPTSAISDRNTLQITGYTEDVCSLEPLPEKLRAFGWNVCAVDGHDVTALTGALENGPSESGKPNAVIARTVKGKGISFMENDPRWHHRVPDDEQYERAQQELDALLAEITS
ncbi:MAG: ATP-binding cassette domain-containing protein [Sedimentisphaerales bacterium]|nr:ATP-binding cassette domain-containing protein [Sedimentisphaerales bacterium]